MKPNLLTAIVLATSMMLLGACSTDDFDSLSEGDCTRGQPRIVGDLERIDCSRFDASQGDHHKVTRVFDEDDDLSCPMGSVAIADQGRVVCFARY